MKKFLKLFSFTILFGILFLFLPLPIKFSNMTGISFTHFINGLDAFRIGGIKSFTLGMSSFLLIGGSIAAVFGTTPIARMIYKRSKEN